MIFGFVLLSGTASFVRQNQVSRYTISGMPADDQSKLPLSDANWPGRKILPS